MSADEGGTFISRWSRRKIAARRAEPAEAAPAAPAPVPPTAHAAEQPRREEAAAPALPDVEALRGLESEYRDFLRPEVDESLRRTALKKLFSDPHFNVMDGLDVYIDDYSKPDPIEPALLRALNQARGLGLFDDEKEPADPHETAVAALQHQGGTGVGPTPSSRLEEEPVLPTDCPPETKPTDPSSDDPGSTRSSG